MIKKEALDYLFKKMHDRHKEMWDELSETGRLRKKTTIIIGDYPHTKNDCFACELIERVRTITGKPFSKCHLYCPISWIPKKDRVGLQGLMCEHENSLYVAWVNTKTINRENRKEFAKQIRDLKWTNKFLKLINLS